MSNVIGGGTVAAAGVDLVEYALCTLLQVKSELNIDEAEAAEDDRISRAINAATDMIETDTNRRLMKRAASVVEYHDTTDTDDSGSPCIWPREYPVESIADVVSFKTGTFLARDEVPLDEIAVDRQRIIVVPDGALTEGSQANELTYTPGYSTTPHDIQGVAINTAQLLYWAAKRIQAGDSAETAGGVSRTEKAAAYSAADQLIINAYKRVDPGDWKVKAAKRKAWTR